MKEKILYLFNSAARPAYKENLHKILALPVGGKVQFRYSIEYHVPPGLGNIPPKCKSLIVFVDRYSEGGYTYYPIRTATVIKTVERQNRFFLECRLSEYCGTNNPELFTKNLRETADKAPELTKGDPKVSSDGFYVQFAKEISDNLITDPNQWFNTVQRISRTKAFKDDHTAFLKLTVLDYQFLSI